MSFCPRRTGAFGQPLPHAYNSATSVRDRHGTVVYRDRHCSWCGAVDRFEGTDPRRTPAEVMA